MDIKKGKGYITLSDLEQHSIWKESEIDDLLYPVTCMADSPSDLFHLYIRTKFYTPYGIELMGYTVGFGDIYCIAICIKDKVFHFNRNLPDYYAEALNKMSKILGKNMTLSNFSPLK